MPSFVLSLGLSFEPISQEPYSSSERERKFSRHLFTSSIKQNIRHFPVIVMRDGKKCTKKRDARAELLLCLFILLLFLTFSFSLSSQHFKVPILPELVFC